MAIPAYLSSLAEEFELSRPTLYRLREQAEERLFEQFELSSDSVSCTPQADLAWPEAKLAVLGGPQLEDRQAFENAGWRILTYPVEVEKILNVLEGAGQIATETREE